MSRPAWMNGPFFDLRGGAKVTWVYLAASMVLATLAVVARDDVWLMLAMWPGIALATMYMLIADARFKKEPT